eukprot:385124_1
MAQRRIKKELKDLEASPIEYCNAAPINAEDLFHWTGTIIGMENTPYKDGIFYFDITFPKDYPFKELTIKFKTKIYHPNIMDNGQIYLFTENYGSIWSPAFTISKALTRLTNIFMEPDDTLYGFNQQTISLYRNSPTKYWRIANECAVKYASAPSLNVTFFEFPQFTNRKYKYDIKTQQIECKYKIKHPNNLNENDTKIHLENIQSMCVHCIIENKFYSQKVDVNNDKEYEFKHENPLVGSYVNITAYIHYEKSKQQSSKQITEKKYISTFNDAKHKYEMLMESYLRRNRNDLICKDIICLCLSFYYEWIVEMNYTNIMGTKLHRKLALYDRHEIWRYVEFKQQFVRDAIFEQFGNSKCVELKKYLEFPLYSNRGTKFPKILNISVLIPDKKKLKKKLQQYARLDSHE